MLKCCISINPSLAAAWLWLSDSRFRSAAMRPVLLLRIKENHLICETLLWGRRPVSSLPVRGAAFWRRNHMHS
ncbi:hypothetical protein F5Y00DRAFT_224571 [Daldinia vernicosa]|uniref:uncharacterized protein n=1 Tax=Daldinia vernicosa TaxID=114800 RepID=UPI002008BD5E|nr:uncharacterized protein F5Y00DRAFT_224571 [Daldinia vernicosa]KAI0853378.1 hypothetical protein F5Y00DRAFT_224571 [Daldinia vernicosa]